MLWLIPGLLVMAGILAYARAQYRIAVSMELIRRTGRW